MNDESPAEYVLDRLERGEREAALAGLDRLRTAPGDDRKAALRALRSAAGARPAAFGPIVPDLVEFLEDDDRAVRLSTAKLFVALAESAPETAVPVASALADRLADDEEFYYVRARCAEALGYLALERPETVASPEVLADLRVGLAFEKPEVREELAKAIECVALGAPDRLAHQTPTLADHLGDENELVRYHLLTALVVVGCETPERLDGIAAALLDCLDDETAHVRGRAAEALGLLAAERDEATLPTSKLEALRADSDVDPFVADRVRFALAADGGADPREANADEVGTVAGVRATTGDAADAITSPDGDGKCSHCGLTLPETGPPTCPGCGAPY